MARRRKKANFMPLGSESPSIDPCKVKLSEKDSHERWAGMWRAIKGCQVAWVSGCGTSDGRACGVQTRAAGNVGVA